jgi:hypothetical protein
MIHFIKEGDIRRVGLNLYRAAGGFVAVWAWYDAVTRIMSYRRFRLRLHIRPWIVRSSGRFNVIEEYLMDYGLALVQREVLQDLSLLEADIKSINESYAYIKSQ